MNRATPHRDSKVDSYSFSLELQSYFMFVKQNKFKVKDAVIASPTSEVIQSNSC